MNIKNLSKANGWCMCVCVCYFRQQQQRKNFKLEGKPSKAGWFLHDEHLKFLIKTFS